MTQGRLFESNARDGAGAPRTRANSPICVRDGCGNPRRSGARPGRFCSPACRRADYRAREAEGFVAERPLPEDPVGRRDVGKAIAAANNRWQLAKAQELALEYLATHEVAIVSDIRAFAHEKGVELEWEKNWVANVFTAFSDGLHWFEPTGVRRKTTHKRGHARKVNEYRLSHLGRIALRERR